MCTKFKFVLCLSRNLCVCSACSKKCEKTQLTADDDFLNVINGFDDFMMFYGHQHVNDELLRQAQNGGQLIGAFVPCISLGKAHIQLGQINECHKRCQQGGNGECSQQIVHEKAAIGDREIFDIERGQTTGKWSIFFLHLNSWARRHGLMRWLDFFGT